MYVYADRILGDFMEAMDGDTTLVVLSDHGFDLGAHPGRPEQDARHAARERALPPREGILYLYGRGVKARARLDQPKILDIAPTVLALAGAARRARHAGPRAGRGARRLESRDRRSPPTRRARARGGSAAAGRAGRPGDPGAAASLGYIGSAATAPRRRRATRPAHAPRRRPQHRRHALRGRALPGGGRRPTRKLVERRPEGRVAAHEPGRRAGRARAATTRPRKQLDAGHRSSSRSTSRRTTTAR